MCKFNDLGIISVIIATILSFFTKRLHKPLRTIKYWKHTILTKNRISDKIIEIELIKLDKSDINRQIRIDEIKFCFNGFDKNNIQFIDNSYIERIDNNKLIFEKNNDSSTYKIKIPFQFSLNYFDAKEIKLTISYKTPLDDDFVIHDRVIDLTEITDKFKILINRQIDLINYQSSISTEERFKIFDSTLPEIEQNEEFDEKELNDNQFHLNSSGKFLNNKGETQEKYDEE